MKVDDFLAHYGVLGMRWGVRKDASGDSITLKKGAELHRVTSNANESMDKGHAYASFEKEDIETYKTIQKALGKKNKSFDLTMKATTDLIAPSEKKRVEAFINLLEKDSKFASELKTTQRRMFILNVGDRGARKMAKRNEGLTRKKAKAYNLLNYAIASKGKLRDRYFKELSDMGYNMIIDEADRRNGVSKTPVVIFDRGESLEVTGVTKLK